MNGSGRARRGMTAFAYSLRAVVIALSLLVAAGVPAARADDSSIYIYGAVLPIVPDLGGKPSDHVLPADMHAVVHLLTDTPDRREVASGSQDPTNGWVKLLAPGPGHYWLTLTSTDAWAVTPPAFVDLRQELASPDNACPDAVKPRGPTEGVTIYQLLAAYLGEAGMAVFGGGL